MKAALTIFMLLILIPALALAQLSDRTWLLGYDEYPDMPGSGHAMIYFSAGSNDVQVDTTHLAFNFESTVAVAAASDGQLKFYSNGCEIANRNHSVMPNGSGLNPGTLSEQVCNWKGYVVQQGAMSLPFPNDTSKFLLLHMGASYATGHGTQHGPLYYSTVDMTLDNGLGDVVAKNNLLLEGSLGSFTAIRHGNGRDWWIVVPEFGNKIWHTFLWSPTGFEERPPQQISMFASGCEHQESLVASLDGSRLASWGDCKIAVTDFDRCDGVISNPVDIYPPSNLLAGGGLAFSPSGRFLYATSQTVLFRADLEASTIRLDTMRFSYDPNLQSPYDVPGNTFHYLENTPGGHIYGNAPSRRRYLHLLNNPDAPSQAALSFVPQGIALPALGARTLPHFPNFNLYDLKDSVCDTLGINDPSVAVRDLKQEKTLSVFPNPFSDRLFIDAASASNIEFPLFFKLYQSSGQLLLEKKINALPIEIELTNLPNTSYFYRIISPNTALSADGLLMKGY